MTFIQRQLVLSWLVLRGAAAFLSLSLTCAKAWGADVPGDLAPQFDRVVSHYARCGYLQGVVLVAQHGQVIYAKGIGEANRLLHTPNTPRTKFDIASITKQFTAALVLQQVAAGRIRLDAAVSDYLPWYRKDTGQRMTIDQLLHHTSGLPADYDDPEFSDSPQARHHYEPEEFAKRFCQPNLVSEPGAKWAYSNCGYVLLGLILEQVTQKTFSDLLNEQLLLPLGMYDTGIDRNDLAQRGGAAGYTRHAGPHYTPGPDLDRSHIFSAGAMYSTAEDLLRWNQALSSAAMFPESVRQGLFTPGMNHWSDGWFVTRISPGHPGAGSLLAEMRGDMPGNFFAWTLRYPEQDAVIIVLRNGYGSTERLEDNLQAVLFNCPTHLPSRNAKDVLAHLLQVTVSWPAGHPLAATFTLLSVALAIWFSRSRPKSRFHTSAQPSGTSI